MTEPRTYALENVRTDGWFERVGASVASFDALCEILGERFFAFSLILGARISALTVDRRKPENTLVEFSPAGDEAASEQLPLREFQGRLVAALLAPSPPGPPPSGPNDTDGLQGFVGQQVLLLAPLYGWRVLSLTLGGELEPQLVYAAEGVEYTVPLEEFREALREQVEAELAYASAPGEGARLELAHVAEAEALHRAGKHDAVRNLLATWPATLTILLRTPEAASLQPETRDRLAHALGLLGSSCAVLGDSVQAEEVFRLAVQYAGEGPAAAQIYERLGVALMNSQRPGEAIGALRRAAALGSSSAWPALAQAFLARGRSVAAMAALAEAQAQGSASPDLDALAQAVRQRLGAPLERWQALVQKAPQPRPAAAAS